MKQRKKSACQLALDHFDLHYKQVYDWQWPSIRVALLSKPKHCALINNFASDRKQIDISLAELGAQDILWRARERFVRKQLKDASTSTHGSTTDEVSVLKFLVTYCCCLQSYAVFKQYNSCVMLQILNL